MKGPKKKCCNNCYVGKPCCVAIQAAQQAAQPLSGKYHVGGVTQLQYVGDDGTGASTGSHLLDVVKYGLLFMGVSCLLGAKPATARLIGIAGVGYGLVKKGWG